MTLAIRDRFELPQDRKALEAAAAVALQYYGQQAGLTVELDALPAAVRGLCDDLAARAPANGRIEVLWSSADLQLRLLAFLNREAEEEIKLRATEKDLADLSDALALDRLNRELRERREKEGR